MGKPQGLTPFINNLLWYAMFAEYQEHLAYIVSTEAKGAYECIVINAAKSDAFDPRPTPRGYMKNVTFFDGAQKPYAVVPADASKALALMGIMEQRVPSEFQSPDEVCSTGELWEGHVKSVTVNAYERSREARFKCIAHHGMDCAVCGMNFESLYGKIGAGYIHVHHLVSIASIGTNYVVDPVCDLRPVCANCHAMLHTSTPPLSIE